MLTTPTILQFKVENPDNDAILDSMAASAYVEQFALEVFGRAEAAMRADKVTKYLHFPPRPRAGLWLTMAQANSRHLSGCSNIPRTVPDLEPART
jgi:hypothetical protein